MGYGVKERIKEKRWRMGKRKEKKEKKMENVEKERRKGNRWVKERR